MNMDLSFNKREKATVSAVTVSFFVFTILLKISNISLDNIVILQNQFLEVFFGGTAEFLSLWLIVQLILALVFLSLALSLLSAYGARKDRYEVGLVSGIMSSIIFLVIFPGIISVFIAAATIVSFSYTVMISNAYFAELKKWRLFRTGSNAVSKALIIINLIIALGIIITISANAGHYTDLFKKDITDTISAAALGTVNIDSPAIKEQVTKRVAELVDTSPLFQSYMKWLPFLTAFSIWIALEFMRSLVFSNVAGIFTSILLRIKESS